MITPVINVKITENLPKGPALRRALAKGLRDGMERIKNRAEHQWTQEAPRSREGSQLRIEAQAGTSGIEVTLGTPRFEARLLETGTKPHAIKPKTAKRTRRGSRRFGNPKRPKRVLAIPLVGRGVIFRRSVDHPGQQPTYWLSRSIEAGLPAMQEEIYASLREVFRG